MARRWFGEAREKEGRWKGDGREKKWDRSRGKGWLKEHQRNTVGLLGCDKPDEYVLGLLYII